MQRRMIDKYLHTHVGYSVSVYGTIGNQGADTNASFFIDGNAGYTTLLSSTSNTNYHIKFFDSNSTISGGFQHNLSMQTSTSANTKNHSNLFLDYIIYEAVLNSTIHTSVERRSWIFIDDTSPSLQYSPTSGWSTDGSEIPLQYNLDMMDVSMNSSLTWPTGSSSIVSVNFTGIYLLFLTIIWEMIIIMSHFVQEHHSSQRTQHS